MTGYRYRPHGRWVVLVSPDIAIMLPGDTAQDTLDALSDLLEDGPEIQSVLALLTGGFGGGLAAVPPFAVVARRKRLHVLLRGPVGLQAPVGGPELTGRDVTTWTERVLPESDGGFVLRSLDDDDGPAAPALMLRIGSGAVLTDRLEAEGHSAARGTTPASSAETAPAEDPDEGVTGALEAEESATINPGLYNTHFPDGGGSSDGDASDGDASISRSEQSVDVEASELSGETGSALDAEQAVTGYDHLWEHTVVRQVEDAAVRSLDDPEDGSSDAVGAESPKPVDHAPMQTQTPATSPPPDTSVPEPQQREVLVPPPAVGLIDSVPWARPDNAAAAPDAPGRPSHDVGMDSDHDGQTIMRSDLQNAVTPAQTQASGTSTGDAGPGTGPLVLARLCALGHANPPESPVCGVCSQQLESDPTEVRRPSLGTMRISTGEIVELDRSLIIGRQPSVSRVQGRGMPKLVQVNSAGGDISRSHVEVRLDGWHVLLCDLKATNGTVLVRSGQPPRRLGEGETAFLLDGDVAQLGDDLFLRFEGLR